MLIYVQASNVFSNTSMWLYFWFLNFQIRHITLYSETSLHFNRMVIKIHSCFHLIYLVLLHYTWSVSPKVCEVYVVCLHVIVGRADLFFCKCSLVSIKVQKSQEPLFLNRFCFKVDLEGNRHQLWLLVIWPCHLCVAWKVQAELLHVDDMYKICHLALWTKWILNS